MSQVKYVRFSRLEVAQIGRDRATAMRIAQARICEGSTVSLKVLVIDDWEELCHLVQTCETGRDKMPALNAAVFGEFVSSERVQAISAALSEVSARELWAWFIAARAQVVQVMSSRPRYIPEVIERHTFLESYEALCRFFAQASVAGDAIMRIAA